MQALPSIRVLKYEVRCFEGIGGVFEGGAGLVGAVRRGVATHGNDDGAGVAGACRVGQGVGDLYRAGHVRCRDEHQFAVGINADAALARVFQLRLANGQLAVVVVYVFVVGLHVDGHRGVDGGGGRVVVRHRGVVHRGDLNHLVGRGCGGSVANFVREGDGAVEVLGRFEGNHTGSINAHHAIRYANRLHTTAQRLSVD